MEIRATLKRKEHLVLEVNWEFVRRWGKADLAPSLLPGSLFFNSSQKKSLKARGTDKSMSSVNNCIFPLDTQENYSAVSLESRLGHIISFCPWNVSRSDVHQCHPKCGNSRTRLASNCLLLDCAEIKNTCTSMWVVCAIMHICMADFFFLNFYFRTVLGVQNNWGYHIEHFHVPYTQFPLLWISYINIVLHN